MTTPIYQTKTWQYANNVEARTPASVNDNMAHYSWFLKAFLMGDIPMVDFDNAAIDPGDLEGLWTMYSSCNSVTAGSAGDGVDYLGGATYDATKWVRAAAGVAHSWMVLKSPDAMGPFYVCIDWTGTSANTVKMVMSKSPFSTGGTTTNRPTATNEATNADVNLCSASVITANKKRAALCTDGNFFTAMNVDGTARFDTFTCGATLAETRAGDAHNFWLINDHSVSTAGAPNTGQTITIWGRSAIAGAITIPGLCTLYSTASSTAVFATVTGLDATDSLLGNGPIVIMTATPASIRGKFVDFSWAPHGLTNCIVGDLVPISGIGEFMRCGMWFVPSNGVFQAM